MDGSAAEEDQADAARGALLLDRHVTGADPPVLRHAGAHRRLHDPVSELQPSDPARLEQPGIWRLRRRHGLPDC